jgi:hypothetical protein
MIGSGTPEATLLSDYQAALKNKKITLTPDEIKGFQSISKANMEPHLPRLFLNQ